MSTYTVAIVGATGAVGATLLQLLEERDFPVAKLIPLASKRSAGQTLEWKGMPHTIEEATPDAFDGVDIAFFSAGGAVSASLAKEAVARGAIVIDNTSHFRMEPTVPLVVPEVNAEALSTHQGIIANPNCSTIQLVAALHGIRERFGLTKLVVSTYQAVSGTGNAAIQELRTQSAQTLAGESPEASVYPHPIAFNMLPHIDVFTDNGFTKEEMKMIEETKKIYSDPSLPVTATCVRVPVERGHSESVYLETAVHATAEDLKQTLAATKGVRLVDDPSRNHYPMPLDAAGQDDILVGRVRADLSTNRAASLWIVADNLRKGAALNAIQIAEELDRRHQLHAVSKQKG